MVFSSLVFISIFLPAVLFIYWLLPSNAGRNILLLAASLLFYAYGEPVYVFLMIASSFFNYAAALWIHSCIERRKMLLTAAVIMNLGMLCIFKYTAFLAELFNSMTGWELPVPQKALRVETCGSANSSAGWHFFFYVSGNVICHRCVSRGSAATEKFYVCAAVHFSVSAADCRADCEIS